MDKDSEVAATSMKVSLLCPVSGSTTPVYTYTCSHKFSFQVLHVHPVDWDTLSAPNGFFLGGGGILDINCRILLLEYVISNCCVKFVVSVHVALCNFSMIKFYSTLAEYTILFWGDNPGAPPLYRNLHPDRKIPHVTIHAFPSLQIGKMRMTYPCRYVHTEVPHSSEGGWGEHCS